jgi:lipoate-protein ligase A
MALDHALLESVQHQPRAVLRLYRWQPACLSFGRHQPARGYYDQAAARELGIDIVRRPTGGLAVLHDRELTYAVIAPVDLLGGPRASYHVINAALVAGLQKLGVPAQLAPGGKRSAFGTTHPCFAEPAAGEVVVAGQKLVGSAQRCEKRTLLQHGSILLDGSQDVVGRMAAVPFDLSGRATTLAALLGSTPPWPALTAALAAGFAEATGYAVIAGEVGEQTAQRASELEALYRSPEWTWRR